MLLKELPSLVNLKDHNTFSKLNHCTWEIKTFSASVIVKLEVSHFFLLYYLLINYIIESQQKTVKI